jgi:hypothetical protein
LSDVSSVFVIIFAFCAKNIAKNAIALLLLRRVELPTRRYNNVAPMGLLYFNIDDIL